MLPLAQASSTQNVCLYLIEFSKVIVSRYATMFLFVFALSLPFIFKNHGTNFACDAVQNDHVFGHLGHM